LFVGFRLFGVILEKLYIAYEAETCEQREINLKNLKLVCIVTLLLVAFVSVGAVNAQTNEATVTATLSKSTVSPGESIVVTVTVQNNVATEFTIIRVGMHSDWMGEDGNGNDRFLGPNLEGQSAVLGSSPYTVPFLVEVPAGTALGTQNFYIGVDAQDSSGEYYSWNSASSAFQVVPTSNTSPTSTPSGTGDTGGDSGLTTTEILMYVAIVAVVSMVLLGLLVVLTLRRRRNRALQKPETKQPPQEPEPQGEPEGQKLDEQPDLGENFDI